MTTFSAPRIGRIVRVATAFGSRLGVVVAGPYAPGYPGEEWMVVPLLVASGRVAPDEIQISAGKLRAAAWAAQPLSRNFLTIAEGDAASEEVERLWALVVAIDEGRVRSPDSSERQALVQEWYAASAEPVLNTGRATLELKGFFARQVVLFMASNYPGLITLEDVGRIHYGPLPPVGSLRANVCSVDAIEHTWAIGGNESTRHVKLRAHHGMAAAG